MRLENAYMYLLHKLFGAKPSPKKTVVPDQLIPHYPEPPENLQPLLQKVPNTGVVLYHFIRQFNISNMSKYWAVDLIENGMETPSIIQLAGGDLDMDPSAFIELLGSIFRELNINVDLEIAYCAYAMHIAGEVVRGERTPRSGFELLSEAAWDTYYSDPNNKGFHRVLYEFYFWLDNVDEVNKYTVKDSGLEKDNVDEWMYQYFEKLVKANEKYCFSAGR